MKKYKNNISYIVADLLLIILYHIIVFMFVKNRTESFWICYAFTFGCFIISLILGLVMWNTTKSEHTSYVGVTIWLIILVYNIIQIVISVFLIVLPLPLSVEIVIQSAIVIAFLVFVMILYPIREQTVNNYNVQKSKINYVDMALYNIDMLRSKLSDSELRDVMDKIYNKVRYSDPMTSDKLEGIEKEILSILSDLNSLNNMTTENVKIKLYKCLDLVDERNRLCLIMK